MTVYNSVATFGGVSFGIGDVTPSEKPATLKSNIGKTFIEKEIPLRNDKNTILPLKGVINGLSRTSGQTVADAIEVDRTALIALQDGFKHTYADGRHSGDFVIVPLSLVWVDKADRESGQPAEFSMTLIEW